QHPDFKSTETPRQLRAVIPECERLVCLLPNDAGVFGLMSKSCARDLWLAINHAADVHRQVKPFVRIERDRISPLHAREQLSRRFREDRERTITAIHMHPKLEAVRNLSDLH